MITRTSQILTSSVKIITALSLVLIICTFSSCRKNNTEKGCEDTVVLGNLIKQCDGTYLFNTNGGGSIRIDLMKTQVIVSHADYEFFRIEFWGGDIALAGDIKTLGHENLNGKHIKDKMLATRTLVFPDGAKITMAASGMDQPIHTISIYDGNESHQFDFATQTVKHGSLELSKAQQLDNAEADGETGTFSMDAEGLDFYNIYQEVTPGNKVTERVELGNIIRENKTLVNDYYDDPRLGHT